MSPVTVDPASGAGERRLASVPVTTWNGEESLTVSVTGTVTSGRPGEVRVTSAVWIPGRRSSAEVSTAS